MAKNAADKKKKPTKSSGDKGGGSKGGDAQPRTGKKSKSSTSLTAREAIAGKKEDASRKLARKSIHPKYMDCKIVCGCGNAVMTRATVPEIQVGVCSNCHPFYTGTQKFVDSAGRVEKFQKRYKWTAESHLNKESKSKKVKKTPKPGTPGSA